MSEIITFTFTVLMGLFALMNPIANTPVFISLVQGNNKIGKKRIAKTATIVAFIIITVFIILGKYIFELFGITIPAFKITGGILIFIIGSQMLMFKKTTVNSSEDNDNVTDVAISPLAVPILAGPGTIVTAMNFVTKADILHIAIVVLCVAFISYIAYLLFISGEKVFNKIGQNIIDVITKIMGLIIAIIGTTMVIEGIKVAFSLK